MRYDILAYALIGYIAVREAWHFYQVNVLINKLSSRGFYEYKLAQTVGKPKEEKFEAPKMDDSEAEDVDGRVLG